MTSKSVSARVNEEANINTNAKPLTVLTFKLAQHRYALPISNVIQIIEMVTITPVPYTPKAIQGIINVRGQITPVMDLRLRFNLPSVPYQLHTPLILTTAGDYNLALVIDSVEEVLEIKPSQMESKESINLLKEETTSTDGPNTAYLSAIAKIDNVLVLILNLEKILSAAETKQLHQATSSISPDGAVA